MKGLFAFRRSSALASLVSIAAISAPGGAAPSANDWASYALDPGGARHSPLKEITPENVGTLRKADLWESTAVPELRVQAARAATAVAQKLGWASPGGVVEAVARSRP